ncbi:MAG: 4-hydroxy-3-methylbut-2-enyl diphosphate reductase, partial [Bacteroidia bacterium]|nr:4-hydroxy-3-methylbut-2-enyl diphosphate reductase [Bacteroidia bacterium]
FSPTLLDFGLLHIYLARHFGFCYGVENAIEIAFKTVEENPGKRIFLLSEMIHNPQVNAGLKEQGVEFLQDTYGKQLIPFEEINSDDIVLIPAFGTTLEIEQKLDRIGLLSKKHNTTCPFVEKVWNRSEAIAKKDYTIIIHGKPYHEETRATFSHAALSAPAVIVKDLEEAKQLAKYINGEKQESQFYIEFKGQYSDGFDVQKDLQRIGVVNQTTMLASDTLVISDFLKHTMIDTYKLTAATVDERFADTRDTLCYATYDNQSAVIGMLHNDADIAIVVGGYNSSNTSHLVELCEEKLPTFFINNEEKIISVKKILHYNIHKQEEVLTYNYMPQKKIIKILITSGASCPDALVEGVIKKVISFYPVSKTIEELTEQLTKEFE